ncbi:MAG: alpha/beta hydrolase [Actinomycetota bacterium]|nr:alpha/beta hydrolase [Actinomycetota bacterium]
MRSREPDRSGYAVRSGVRLYYEVFGAGPVTVLLLPSWAIVDARTWKLQVPYLARHFRVVTFDPRGNGRSDRPCAPADYADAELVVDALAVLAETGTDRAVCIGLSLGGRVLLQLAAAHPERVAGAVFVAPALRMELGLPLPKRQALPFEEELDSSEGWSKYNIHHWRRDLADFAEFFFGEVFAEPHSTKQVDDAVSWALQTDAETLAATARAPSLGDGSGRCEPTASGLAAQVRCPALVVHGSADRIVDHRTGLALAGALGCPVEVFDGGGHCVHARHPVRFNLLIRQFCEAVAGARA